MIPAAGTTLGDGRYRLERRLGAGGMASVWYGVDERLGRPVAVKLVADSLIGDEQWVRRYEREARAAAAVSHPGIVPVLDYGVQDGRPFLVMQYIPGGSLAERLGDPLARRPDPETVARQLLEALAHVHAAGFVHRDIKPANLLLDERNDIRLTDFGIAQPEDATALTQTGMVVGTVRYLAPEVLAGEPATVRSDLYSAGIVIREVARHLETPPLRRLIEALTASDAAERPTSADDAHKLLDVPSEARNGASEDTAALTRRMLLRPTHRQRPTTARARVVPPSAPPRGNGNPAAAPPSTHGGPQLSIAAVVGALAAAALLVAFVIMLATSAGDSSVGRPPVPAPAGASLNRQLDGLQRIVDYARAH